MDKLIEKYGPNAYFTCNGRLVTKETILKPTDVVQVYPRILGGKGGFGSLLRAMGKQISKTTNKDMCRDLTGRRIGDVEKEKKLKDMLKRSVEIEQKKKEEKAERKKRRRELLETNGRGVGPKVELIKFYIDKDKISEDLQAALREGLKRKREEEKPSTSKAAASEPTEAPQPKKKRWMDEEEEAMLAELSDDSECS